MANNSIANWYKRYKMNEKPPFEPPHNCICSYPDLPILEFYKGYFEAVYLILHPFYTTGDNEIVTNSITWREFLSMSKFEDINRLDIALRNNIGGLVDKWANKSDVDVLRQTCDLHNLQMPSEGVFQEALRIDMLMSLQEEGHPYIFVADEFGFERKLDYISEMIEKRDEVTLTWGAPRNWYTNRNEILYTTHWDSHFTLLCSDTATIKRILAKHHFEGFYCNNTTEIYWSLKRN